MKRTLLLILVTGIFLLSACVAVPEQEPAPSSALIYELQLLSWRNYTEYGYIHVVGEVKNISNSKLDNVTAVVTFRTEDGTLVKTDEALIDYNPLMSGQTSAFTVLATENPAIKKLSLGFQPTPPPYIKLGNYRLKACIQSNSCEITRVSSRL